MADRGRDTSYELVQVRTVLSRAETAIEDMANYYIRYGDGDQDRLEMERALKEVVRLLDRWRRTGRPLKGGKNG